MFSMKGRVDLVTESGPGGKIILSSETLKKGGLQGREPNSLSLLAEVIATRKNTFKVSILTSIE